MSHQGLHAYSCIPDRNKPLRLSAYRDMALVRGKGRECLVLVDQEGQGHGATALPHLRIPIDRVCPSAPYTHIPFDRVCPSACPSA